MSSAKLILASRSPRRAALLREAGYRFDQLDPPFDDPPHPRAIDDHSPGQLAAALARRKAESLRAALRNDPQSVHRVLLAADTICVGVDGGLIGQPQTLEQARAILLSFTHHEHEVVTGVALLALDSGNIESFSDTAVVIFGQLDTTTLNSYLDSGQWRGKAGGYNLFDRQAAGWPVRCALASDPTTVVGLPMRRLRPMLQSWNVRPESSATTGRGPSV